MSFKDIMPGTLIINFEPSWKAIGLVGFRFKLILAGPIEKHLTPFRNCSIAASPLWLVLTEDDQLNWFSRPALTDSAHIFSESGDPIIIDPPWHKP